MAAVLAEGETLFENCAREPEVTDLAALLTAMGAKIKGAGTSTIRVQGVSKGFTARATRSTPTGSKPAPSSSPAPSPVATSTSKPATLQHLGSIIAKLEQCWRHASTSAKTPLRVRSFRREPALRLRHVSTEEYPGFPTDMQAQYMALATQSEGTTVVTENIFENRFMHVGELNRMGANITVNGRPRPTVAGFSGGPREEIVVLMER